MKTSFILLFFLITILCCSTKTENNEFGKVLKGDQILKNHNVPDNKIPITMGYDCDSFQYSLSNKYYIDLNGDPLLSKMDSNNIMEYAKSHGQIVTPKLEKDVFRFYYLLTRTRNIINTKLYDENIKRNDSIKFMAFDKYQIDDLINSDAVVIGEVVDKRYLFDTANCYYYKKEYIVKVIEVLHSYFKLEKENRVLLKEQTGYYGACDSIDAKSLLVTHAIHEFGLGEKWIFFLKHNDYYTEFFLLQSRNKNGTKYSDKYCSHAFEMYAGNYLFDFNNKTLVNNMRLFYKTIFKN